MSGQRLPITPGELTVDKLNAVIAQLDPSALLAGFEVTAAHTYGEGNVSTSGRIELAPVWQTPSDDLPKRLVMKTAHASFGDFAHAETYRASHGALYENEAAIYRRLQPWRVVEAPRAFGAAHDPASFTQLIILEDLRERGVTFPSVLVPVPLAQAEDLMDQLAILHARYWNSPELETSLAWMQHHTRGAFHDLFTGPDAVPMHVAHSVETVQFKREMVERLGLDVWDLYRQFVRVQQHQARLPQTVCHGDTHVGNTYTRPGHKAGLLDWQLSSIGYCLHDVSYALATSQTVDERRRNERDLLARYRERLREHGVAEVPSPDDLWLEYRRAAVWGIYIGWLPTPVVNYGWEIAVMAHLRVMTAYEDLETQAAIATID